MEIRKANSGELKKIKRIYLEAFPRAERKPFGMMKRKARQGGMEILSILEDGRLVGLAITFLHQDMVLLDYFAMERTCRGKGFGAGALEILKERYREKRLILEIELADLHAGQTDLRVRRKHFYLQNGMKETGIHIRLFGVPMEILTEGRPLTYEEYRKLYENMLGSCFAKKVLQKEQ